MVSTDTRRARREARADDPGRRSVPRMLGSALLTLLAAGGLVCIGLVVAALMFHITIVMFATGSMSPTIPAGSIAFVREIPASDIRVGDVVTVDRSPRLPITHRVTAIDGRDGEAVAFHMKGDANTAADPVVYREKSVGLVMWSMPGVAGVLVWFRNPLVLAAITIAATALVTWAFWPRDEALRDAAPRSRGDRPTPPTARSRR